MFRFPHARFAALVFVLTLLSGSVHAATPRILLVGDSWASRAWDARVFQTALASRGLGQFEEKGDVTAIGGTKASHWVLPGNLAKITSELINNPEIDIVHLSIGVNDYGFAPPGTDLQALLAQVLADIQTVVDHILSIRPEARIVWASYDYMPLGINPETLIVSEALAEQALATPNFFVLNNMGVLHHEYGYYDVFGPGETPLPGSYPEYIPHQGGDAKYPGSFENFDDTVHPSTDSLLVLAEFAVDEFYADFLAPPNPVPSLGLSAGALLILLLALAGILMLHRGTEA